MMKLVTVAAVICLCSSIAAQEAPKPGKEQELLKQFTGEWEATSKFIMDPKDKPAEGKGAESSRMTCGGMWLVFDYKGTVGTGEFDGHGTMGWDTAKKKFVGTWVDNFSARISLMEGEFDKEGKVLSLTSDEVGMDGKPFKMKQVITFKDKDTRSSVFSVETEGKWSEMGWMDYKRKK